MHSLVDIKLEIDKKVKLPFYWNDFIDQSDSPASLVIRSNDENSYYYGMDIFSLFSGSHVLYSNSGLLIEEEEWKKGILCIRGQEGQDIDSLLILFIYSHLIPKQTLLFHSSLVDLSGSGIMFLGPSGIGKTTQAELWNKYLGADILNGDMVFARKNEDGFYGYGSPWHGSSPYYKNAKVKLKALVVLEQAGENTLKRLEGFDVLQGIMEQVFLPHWYPEAMDTCLNTLDLLLEEVPVYHLACRPDEDAVLLLKQELGL